MPQILLIILFLWHIYASITILRRYFNLKLLKVINNNGGLLNLQKGIIKKNWESVETALIKVKILKLYCALHFSLKKRPEYAH